MTSPTSHSFSVREVQPATKLSEAQVEEEEGVRLLVPDPAAITERWGTRPWSFTPRAEPAISLGEPVAEKTSNLCYMLRMVDDEEPVEKAFMASLSAAITS